MARKAAGEEPLPEEDPSNPIFKPLPEPSRLDSYLITNQVSNYCNQINGYVSNDRPADTIYLNILLWKKTHAYLHGLVITQYIYIFYLYDFVNYSDRISV